MTKILKTKKLFRKIWIALAIMIILAAVFSSIFRSLTPWAKQYKGEVEHHLSLLLGQPVTVQTMETGWYWFQPVLKLQHVTITTKQNNSLQVGELLVGINLFKSLWHRQIQPGMLYIESMHLNLREIKGQWHIDGISTDSLKGSDMTPERTQNILEWLARQERLIIKQVSAHVYFSDGTLLPISGLNISVINHGGNYKIKGMAKLEQTNATSFQLDADLRFDPFHYEKTSGTVYFSAKQILPAQWQNIVPKPFKRLEGGKGDVSIWMDLKQGTFSSIQTQLKFKRLVLHLGDSKTSQVIQSLSANAAWKPNDKGWQLLADKIQLRVGGLTWPENNLEMRFDKVQNSYQFFIKSIIVESLSSLAVDWPKDLQNTVKLKPQGILSDTQVLIKESQLVNTYSQPSPGGMSDHSYQLSYILTRFNGLGWKAQDNIPEVSNLSGVLNWQPDEGKLELDSENTSITLKGYPVQNIKLLNGSFDWKELSNGLRVSIDRFVLSQPDLTLSAQGVVDDLTRQSLGHVRLSVEFSGKNLQQWLPLLPAKHLKPKLLDWLQHDIKRMAEATGKIIINGLAKDFPFDNNTGEFTITGHGSGVDLLFTPKWQLSKNIEAYLRLKNRNLEVDVVQGDFQGVPVKQLNLRIDDIGKDKETLLIHGIIEASVQKMIDFVLHSPLHEKLSALEMFSLEGLALLNLQLEIPLYPENNTILAKGNLVFRNNRIVLKNQAGKLTFNDLSGELAFDQEGVTQSALVGTAFGYPLNVHMQSMKTPKPYTQVIIDGKCRVNYLKSHLKASFLSLVKGMFFIKAEIKLPHSPDEVSQMILTSSLEGLSINLPAPLGKDSNTKAPTELTFDFDSKKYIRMRANYEDRLSSDLWFKEEKGIVAFHSGQVMIGSASASNQKKRGLEVLGTLEGFDLTQWNKVFTKLSTEQARSNLLDYLRVINVKLGKFTFFGQRLDQLSVVAKLLKDKNWSFDLEQKNISANLFYNPANHALGGHIKRLHLEQINSSKNTGKPVSDAHPNQIPNLDLRIDNLSVAAINVGSVLLKSHSSARTWLIDSCRIESSVYQSTVQGEWTQKNKVNQTKMHFALHLNDLSKTLELWHITPAVAGKGDMEFHGGWNSSVYDFSLAKLNGTMQLKLKNGIITHLSPETEEKLGLGKLLSILSLQTIPRRLTLDFSDLSHQGYSFDIFQGSFSIKNGIMSTQDSYIDGPVAYASMKGDLDLVRHLYDLNLNISPHITASLPIVATIAGGPVAGIATWAASKLINQSMQKITGYSYKVSGPWSQPIVQQLSIRKGGTQ